MAELDLWSMLFVFMPLFVGVAGLPVVPVGLAPLGPSVVACPNAARTAFVGLNRNAAFGTRSTLSRRITSTVSVAVIPGFSLSSAFGADTIAA